jgi:Ni2+-binding GTPase involved in maturation of urease and hydrogenase
MNLHLVGGFLGSGKTTAIIEAAKLLINKGLKVGVVTNDQGKYLVDTAFVKFADLPAVEVTGGCFCCNYDDLNQQLIQLIAEVHPDVVFAESVGSCADIVATIIKPLQTFNAEGFQPETFSVFVDSRLLLRRIKGLALPFSDDVVYIFDKQIEEAGLLVLNKVDLLSETEKAALGKWADTRKSNGPWHFQNSLERENVANWVTVLQSGALRLPDEALEIDYLRYSHGEAQMAWLDETLALSFPEGGGRQILIEIISELLKILEREKVAIGHLKFVLTDRGASTKISFTGLEELGWQNDIPVGLGGVVQILINLRAEAAAHLLHQHLRRALFEVQNRFSFDFQETNVDFFHPGKPEPTHRLS